MKKIIASLVLCLSLGGVFADTLNTTNTLPTLEATTAAVQSIDGKTPTLVGGKVPVDATVSTISLPTGASTSALQTTGNASVASVDTKTPALGQALASASSPVVLPVDQVSTLTPPSNTGYALDTSVNSLLKPASTLAAVTSITNPVAVTGTFWQAVQPISGNVTVVGAGDASATNQLTQISQFPATLGQKTAAESLSVTLASDDLRDLMIVGQQTTTIGNNLLLPTAGTDSTDLLGYRSASVQIVSTSTSGNWIFEGSNDNINFQTLPVFQQLALTGTPITSVTTATVTQLIYTFPVTTRYVRLRVSGALNNSGITAYTKASQVSWTPAILQIAQNTASNLNTQVSGTVTANLGTGGTNATSIGKAEDAVAGNGDTIVAAGYVRTDAMTSNTTATNRYGVPSMDQYGATLIKDQQRHKRTYRTAFVVAPAASATDVFQLIGSASTTVEINRILISGTQTTGGMVDLYVKKRSTANTGGTSSAATLVPMISTDAAATAVGAIYTANPTPGADVGSVFIESIPLSGVAATTNNIVKIDFGERGKPLTLVGVAQTMAINLNGVTVTGGSLKITVEFTEY